MVLRAEIAGNGIALARTHVRINSTQLHNAIRKRVGIDGAPDDPLTLMAMVGQLPPGAIFSAFSIGRMQLPFVAMALLAGGNIRVGLEDNIWLSRGVPATNAQLVERAVRTAESMGARILGPADVRAKLRLEPRLRMSA